MIVPGGSLPHRICPGPAHLNKVSSGMRIKSSSIWTIIKMVVIVPLDKIDCPNMDSGFFTTTEPTEITERGETEIIRKFFSHKTHKTSTMSLGISEKFTTTEPTETTEREIHNLIRRMPSFSIFTLKLMSKPTL